MNHLRRQLITGISVVGAGALLVGCRNNGPASSATNKENKTDEQSSDEAAAEISASEDLMREHGILRRALFVYQEAAIKLKQDAASVPADALEKTAQLFRAFGEDYHEKKLEETYIFPALKKTQNAASVYADVLLAQHARGREITDYILATTKADKIPEASVGPFITTLETFVRMYDHHATVEDTIVFPAWKEVVGSKEMDEIGAKFEEIEEQFFGDDGFEAASKRMAEIEESLGLANLGMFTAPPPPAHQ
ncbi:MAG TPA: hemerythrin domain-containing protein [Pyrinomonadaceae bacterium]